MQTRYLNPLECSGAERIEREAVPSGIAATWTRTAGTLRLWWRRYRQRAQLNQLLGRDNHFFQDIGVSRATVYNEGSKWFWQA